MRGQDLYQPRDRDGALSGPGADVLIGTAGWSVPADLAERFPGEGTHLHRYAGVLPAAEINSSFHRPHRRSTWQRWADTVPPAFRFAVKLPRTISHRHRLVAVDDLLNRFIDEASGLGDKLAVLLVQLPPSCAFEPAIARAFFAQLHGSSPAAIACEPRHPSWFAAQADTLLADWQVARVAADPILAPGGTQPGGWSGLRYHRLHGAPRVYHSAYGAAYLAGLAERLRAGAIEGIPTWCIFDNTASGAATADALALRAMLGQTGGNIEQERA